MSLVLPPLYYKYIYIKGTCYSLYNLVASFNFLLWVHSSFFVFCFFYPTLFLESFRISPSFSSKRFPFLSLFPSFFFSKQNTTHTHTRTCTTFKKTPYNAPPLQKKHTLKKNNLTKFLHKLLCLLQLL